MRTEDIREYILSKPGARETKPFTTPVPVFKVALKMFALTNIHEDRPSINLKNHKEDNIALREAYPEIIPGYHMNKSWWNTVYLDGALTEELVKEMIDTSYI